ncbi:MAG TPA: MOSC N-terminal beta barrel domain-containing protein [Pirellulales bacterium]|nr:MOSC N-terminal beta barrel domain-containing protein [Pirellulales bacterium]
MSSIGSLWIYPIKSLPGKSVETAKILRAGNLEFDRRWAICDASGEVVNAKRTAAIHPISATYDDAFERVTLAAGARFAAQVFSLADERQAIERWLSQYFGFACVLVENAQTGIPDDLDSPGPTIVSTATLELVASWFPGVAVDEARRRFRANVELAGVEPFWEDRLYGPIGETRTIHLGQAVLDGVNPCQRCIVPSRDSLTGEMTFAFSKRFAEHRRATLPAWAAAERFNHFYRLAVNTRAPLEQRIATLRVGDPVAVV